MSHPIERAFSWPDRLDPARSATRPAGVCRSAAGAFSLSAGLGLSVSFMARAAGANLGRGLLEGMQAHDRIAWLTIGQDHRSRPRSQPGGTTPPASRGNLQDGPLHTLDQILEHFSERPDRQLAAARTRTYEIGRPAA